MRVEPKGFLFNLLSVVDAIADKDDNDLECNAKRSFGN